MSRREARDLYRSAMTLLAILLFVASAANLSR